MIGEDISLLALGKGSFKTVEGFDELGEFLITLRLRTTQPSLVHIIITQGNNATFQDKSVINGQGDMASCPSILARYLSKSFSSTTRDFIESECSMVFC